MEEKFDEEFRKKVRGINPEIPDVIRMRIDDTLASLPVKRNFWRSRYIGAAALFLICYIGIRYIYPMQSARRLHPESTQNSKMAVADASGDEENQRKADYTKDAKTSEDKTVEKNATGNNNVENRNTTGNKNTESNTNNTTYGTLKTDPATQSAGSSGTSAGTASKAIVDTAGMKMSLTSSGKSAEDQGIQLTLKTATYDGKEIRIEFDKTSAGGNTLADSSAQKNYTTSASKSESMLKSAQVNVGENYEVRVVIDNIPLKCSINILESSQGENQCSGTMIIIPDSELPEKFNMVLSFDKIDDLSGQWLLTTQVSKQ